MIAIIIETVVAEHRSTAILFFVHVSALAGLRNVNA